MDCPKCQFGNREEVKFCEECGAKLEQICPECEAKIPLGRKFCGECGHRIAVPEETTPSPDYSAPHSYTPKHLTDKILNTRSSIEGERKLVTVLFADVANFTALSEQLDPEEVHQIMDGCFQILMDEIHRHEGTINQFTGDGVMALFGAPVAHEDHAQRACHAALSIQNKIRAYGEKIEKECGVAFQMRIGLNSGPVIVGSIGDDLRMDYTAVGDTTNLASRMEGLAGPGSILVSENTYQMTRDYFRFESLGEIEVKGKAAPQEAHELLGRSEVETRMEAAAAKGLTRFVGRKNSMAALVEAFDEARSGSGQVVGIVGEAGVGKSRLLFEFRTQRPRAEFAYLEGRCLHYGGAMPYLPVLDILRSYFGMEEGDREFVAAEKIEGKVLGLDEALRPTLPCFQDLLSLPVNDEGYRKLDPKEKRDRTFEAIRDLLIRVSQTQPLVIAMEDLHWIDQTSEEFLDYLIGWIANTRILLVLLYRSEYTHSWGSKSYYNHVGLRQLTAQSSAELVQAILEGGEIAPELRELILNRTAGNPLFVEELTQTLLANGSIQKRDHEYVLNQSADEISIPGTIEGIISARIDRLEENLKRTMQVASVIGRDFAFRILQTITGMREELKSNLVNLQGLELIYEKQLFPELEYIFKHALTQEVAYNSLLARRRRELHENIGSAIETIYAERLEEFYEMLAYHYSKSENWEKAYPYLTLAGEKAAKAYANREALRFYQEAGVALGRLPVTEANQRTQLDVVQATTPILMNLAFPEGSLEILQEGERLGKALGDQQTLARIYGAMGACHSFKGDAEEALKYTEHSFWETQKAGDVDLMASAAFPLCIAYHATGEYRKIVDVATGAISLLERTQGQAKSLGGIYMYPLLHAYLGFAVASSGDFRKGEADCQKAVQFATKFDDVLVLALAETMNGALFMIKGDALAATGHLENSIHYCEQGQMLTFLGMTRAFLGWAHALTGDLSAAKSHAEKGLKIHLDTGRESHLSALYMILSRIHCDLGDLPEAERFVDRALQISQENNERGYEGYSRITAARIMAKGQPAQRAKAEASIRHGIEILETLAIKPFYAEGYLALGELYAGAGESEPALENLKKAEAMFLEMGMDYYLDKTRQVLENL